jgi:hypothetical protein
MLETRDTRLPACDAFPNRMSPVGRSIHRAGAFGEEGEVKVYWSGPTCTLISRKGSVILCVLRRFGAETNKKVGMYRGVFPTPLSHLRNVGQKYQRFHEK